MSVADLFFDDRNIAKLKVAVSQILEDAIGQAATVLVPAIEQAAKNTVGGIVVTVGPIHIEPITITLKADGSPPK